MALAASARTCGAYRMRTETSYNCQAREEWFAGHLAVLGNGSGNASSSSALRQGRLATLDAQADPAALLLQALAGGGQIDISTTINYLISQELRTQKDEPDGGRRPGGLKGYRTVASVQADGGESAAKIVEQWFSECVERLGVEPGDAWQP